MCDCSIQANAYDILHFRGIWSDMAAFFINTLRPRQNWRYFADDIFKCIFLNAYMRHSASMTYYAPDHQKEFQILIG